MKTFLRLMTTSLILVLVAASPAEALFGSECKKPKATYAQYLSSSKKLQIKEAGAQAAARTKADSDFFRCTLNPKAFLLEKNLKDTKTFPRNREGCSMWKIFYGGGVPYYAGAKTAVEEYKNAMLIVTSYKKCFDPSVYIEAVKWLKANPK